MAGGTARPPTDESITARRGPARRTLRLAAGSTLQPCRRLEFVSTELHVTIDEMGRHGRCGRRSFTSVQHVDYDRQQYQVYAKARAIPADRMSALMAQVTDHLPTRRPLVIADVGCGVGRFTPALATEFGGPVFGIEPAQKMRRQAEEVAAHPQVTYLDGRAERIPLPDAACDAAFLWFVWHHIADRQAAAIELARVVRSSGTALLRTNTSDRMPDQWWFDHFPRAREVEASRCNTLRELIDIFAGAGWQLSDIGTVEVTSTYGRDLDMLRVKAISTLEHLTDEEFAMGVERASAATNGQEAEPVVSSGDLFVLTRAVP